MTQNPNDNFSLTILDIFQQKAKCDVVEGLGQDFSSETERKSDNSSLSICVTVTVTDELNYHTDRQTLNCIS